jgi:cell division protein FtsB
MEKERQLYLAKIRRLEKTNQELLEQINRLRNDNEYIETVARRELGLVKKDEIIFRFRNEQDDKTRQTRAGRPQQR